MTAVVPVVLAVAALLTSILSAILGMGGGILLLALMLCFMTHGEAIPTHALVQIASNGTRVLAFLRDLDRRAFGRFCLGLLPGSGIGIAILWVMGQPEQSEPYLKTLIGGFILVATNLPARGAGARDEEKSWDFPLMGLVAGAAALTVGAVGPLIAPLFARRRFVKERLIATKAMCQLATHVVKIPAFLLMRELDVTRLGLLASIMIVMVIPGTLVGKRILKVVPERFFAAAYRWIVTIVGAKILVFDGLGNLVGGW